MNQSKILAKTLVVSVDDLAPMWVVQSGIHAAEMGFDGKVRVTTIGSTPKQVVRRMKRRIWKKKRRFWATIISLEFKKRFDLKIGRVLVTSVAKERGIALGVDGFPSSDIGELLRRPWR